MKTYVGGEQVVGGFYWNTRTWEFIPVAKPTGALPGGTDARYFRAPAALVLVLGPLMGLGYFLFLPVIGPAMLLVALSKKLGGLFQQATVQVAVSALPSWVPGVSYLAHRAGGRKKAFRADGLKQDTHIDAIEKEIKERRNHGER